MVSHPVTTDCVITVPDLSEGVSYLKHHNSDDCTRFTSDNFVRTGVDCLVRVVCSFIVLLIHVALLNHVLLTTITPTSKRRKANKSISSNFRGISSSSVYGKSFDNFVSNRHPDKLSSYQLQFAFKLNSSTYMCTSTLTQTFAYYNNNNIAVNCASLRTTKAFHRV